jgi:hypothetical protein
MDKLRASVRPLVTYLVVLALGGLVVKSAGMIDTPTARDIIFFFLGVAATIIAFWFGARQNKPPETPTK